MSISIVAGVRKGIGVGSPGLMICLAEMPA